MSTEEEQKIEKLEADFFQKRLEAEEAAYAWCCELPVGIDRERAFEIYERMRNVTRIYV